MAQAHIVQWNSQSLRRKKHEILHFINVHSPIVFAISETWLVPGSYFRIPGYCCLRDDRDDGYAGAAVLVKRTIPYSQIVLPHHSDGINAVAVRVLNVSILSLYIPTPHSSLIPDLYLIVSSLPAPVLILGDFNAHHVTWGSFKTDQFALALIELFDEFNLCVLNDGSPTRRPYPSQTPNSVPDLSISSASFSSLISWSVLSSTHGSDHFPILLSLLQSPLPCYDPSPSFKYRISRADWPSYYNNLDDLTSVLPTPTEANSLEIYQLFVSAIIDSANKCIPIKSSKKHRLSTPWWDSDCSAAIKRRKEAERSYRVDMTTANFLLYQEAAAQATRLLSQKKKDGWRGFCESMSPKSPPSLVWRQLRRYRGALNQLNVSCTDTSLWLDGFASKLAPPSVPHMDSLPSSPSFVHSSDPLDAPFTSDELTLALDGLSDSSPGIDNIPYSFIKKSSISTQNFYLSLVNTFYTTGTVPDAWKTQIIIPIVKPGKDPSNPNSYRPIALSSVLAKIMEILIKNRLEWFMESRHILAKSQFGFRKGYSTLDSLSVLITDIRIALKKKHYVLGVFLDIAAAYDSVLLSVLKQKLQRFCVPVRMTRFITNLLMCRTIRIKSNGSLLPPRQIWRGLPQGSVLSPLLYSIYTSDLESVVSPTCDILQYADDLALYVSSESIAVAESRVNMALSFLSDWLINHGLSLSVSKSSVVIFSNKRNSPDCEIVCNGEVFPIVNEVRFLGVILDKKMTAKSHIAHISEKCERGINVLRAIAGVRWGAHPYCLKLIYNAIVRSHFDYGSFILEPCNKLAIDSWSKIQNKCLRIISGAMKSSPVNALQVECCDPPLHLRRQYLADKFFYRALQLSHHPLLHKLEILRDLVSNDYRYKLLNSFSHFLGLPHPVCQLNSNPLYSSPFEALLFRPVFHYFGIFKDTPGANSIFNQELAKNWQGWTPIFTDASKVSESDPVGSAVWIPRGSIILSFKCPSVASSFTGEAIALLEAILYIESHNLNKSLIFSDSLSCLQAICANPFRSKFKHPVVFKIREALYHCHCKKIEVGLFWIPSHCGIVGNESADWCAKSAIRIGSELEHPDVYCQDLSNCSRTRLQNEWSNLWSKSRLLKGKFYGDIQTFIPSKPWFFKHRKFGRSVSSTICRMRLGHACTPVHLAKIRVRDHSLCECGLEEGDLDHLFFNCGKLSASLYDVLPAEIPRPCNMKFLLSLADTPLINIVARFISMYHIKL